MTFCHEYRDEDHANSTDGTKSLLPPRVISIHYPARQAFSVFFFFFLLIRRPPSSPLFPYPPLFRSEAIGALTQQAQSLMQSQNFLEARRVLRSEEHTSELQSLRHLVCRLLLEKK